MYNGKIWVFSPPKGGSKPFLWESGCATVSCSVFSSQTPRIWSHYFYSPGWELHPFPFLLLLSEAHMSWVPFKSPSARRLAFFPPKLEMLFSTPLPYTFPAGPRTSIACVIKSQEVTCENNTLNICSQLFLRGAQTGKGSQDSFPILLFPPPFQAYQLPKVAFLNVGTQPASSQHRSKH